MISSAPALAEPTNTGLSLDLSSKNASIAATSVGKTGVAINVGGTTGVVGSGSYSTLTPAEYLAALQVVSTGHQTLNLNSSGQAISGTFTLPAASSLASLVVPTGVTGVYNIASSNQLNVTGNFTNSGSFYVVSSSQGANSAVLNAVNIVNNQGALLSSVLPAGGLAGFSNLISSLNLTLNAINNISNFGSITSSGSLNMIAGNQIINSNVASAALANISAVNNISMIAPHIDNSGQIVSALNNIRIQSANLVNSGLLDSVKGNISISNLVQKVLDINNVGGLIEAKNTLTISNRSTSTLSAINFEGGILEASKIRFVDRKGSVFVALDDISNKVAFTAQHVGLDVSNGSGGLTLTGLNKSADVSLSFNGSGNVTSTGFNTLGQDVVINTTGAIKLTGNIVTTPSTAGDAGSVILNAGQSLTTKNISTNGSGDGNGGSITLTAGTTLNAGALSASGGISGNPGIITLATKSGNARLV
ncbi:MAG: hypothetical protein K2X81_24050 [Candidatus Obscuribacterales bacterium]|nr:hypothetical protein [Candidatus Obscuribacterales bacterium]